MVPDTPGYEDNCETNLVEMIRQHYNHPCIIAWGYMNEILLIAPTPDKPEWPTVRDRTVRLAQRLEKRLKEEDPSRVSVMAFHGSDLYNTIGLALGNVAGTIFTIGISSQANSPNSSHASSKASSCG